MSAVLEKRVVVEEMEVDPWEKLETQEDRLTHKIEQVSLSNTHTLKKYIDLTIEKQKQMANKLEGVYDKNSSIEMRLMYKDLELSECVRQLHNCIEVYNHDCSGLEWCAGIFLRELGKLEKIERQRLSMGVMAGLVDKANVPTIIKKKLQLTMLGLVTQVLERLEGLDLDFQKEHACNVESKKLVDLSNAYWALDVNLKYLLESIEPLALRLNFMDGLSKPYKACKTLEKHMSKAAFLRTCH